MEKKKNNRKIWMILFIVITLLLYGYIYIVPKVSDIFVETYIAEYGVLEIGQDASCLLVRNEKVYCAENGGAIERNVPSGELMRKGSNIVTVNGVDYRNKEKGIISYYYDDLESTFLPAGMENIRSSVLQNLKDGPAEGEKDFSVRKCVKDSASVGDKLFKVVDNSQWYLIFWKSTEDAKQYEVGNTVTVRILDENSQELKMEVAQCNTQGHQTQVILSCDRYYEKFDRVRMIDCKVIRSNKKGIILEPDSIVEIEGKTGVFIVNKYGSYDFTPVKILSTNGKETVVEKNYYQDANGNMVETIRNYYEVLRSQELIAELVESEKNVD